MLKTSVNWIMAQIFENYKKLKVIPQIAKGKYCKAGLGGGWGSNKNGRQKSELAK